MKRLLIGDPNPWLLVEVADDYDPKLFEFLVINGGWRGWVRGHGLHIEDDIKPTAPRVVIISDDQDLLAGDYNRVIESFKK